VLFSHKPKPQVILVAEDDPSISQMYQTKLEAEGYKTAVAHDGEKAVQLLEENQPALILLDIMMPGINGLDFITYMRRFNKYDSIKIIILTNLDDANMRRTLATMDISDYIVKAESTPTQVVAVVQKLLAPPPTPPK
jgi:DNA-binding response OmpR family regulator